MRSTELIRDMLVVLPVTVLMAACGQTSADSQQADTKMSKQAKLQRFERGPFISNETHLTSNEVLKIVTFPDKHGPNFDTNCFIYTNAELKVAQFSCPELTQSDMSGLAPEQDKPGP